MISDFCNHSTIGGDVKPEERLDSGELKVARTIMPTREVYFIRAVTLGLIKIGVTNFTLGRLKNLQVDSPDKLEVMGVLICNNYGTLEKRLHIHFGHHRQHGEWFHPGDDLLAFIRDHAASDDDVWRWRKGFPVSAKARRKITAKIRLR